MEARVKALYPHTKVVYVEDVQHGLQQLGAALGLQPVAGVSTNSADWPFVD